MQNRSRLSGLSWIEVVKRICQRSWEDEVFGQSARLSFYFFFALFPLLLLLLIVLERFAGSDSGWRGALVDSLNQILPLNVSQLLANIINQLSSTAVAGGGAIAGGVSAVWGILNGTLSIFTGLNNAYEVKEERSWWRLLATTIAMTFCLCALALGALAAIRIVGGRTASADPVHLWRQLLEWCITIALHALCFALLYRFGPSLKHPEWKWSVPGAIVAAALWALFTSVLRLYQHHDSATQRIYGGLTATATLLLWLYLIGGAIFLGAETNAVIAKAARQDPKGARHEPDTAKPH